MDKPSVGDSVVYKRIEHKVGGIKTVTNTAVVLHFSETQDKYLVLLNDECESVRWACDHQLSKHKSRKARPMTRLEMMRWARSDESIGWVVQLVNGYSCPSADEAGASPLICSYNTRNNAVWWRSKLDETTGMPTEWERMEVEE